MVKLIALTILIIALLYMISKMMKLSFPLMEKKSMFECGFDPSHENHSSFSLRFFMITIIFLLFDLEITFIMPLPLQININNTNQLYLTHILIILLFSLSMYLEWKQGALNWLWLGI